MSDPLVGQRTFSGEVVGACFASEGFCREVSLCEAHAAESISYNVVLAFDVGQLGTPLFSDEAPATS